MSRKVLKYMGAALCVMVMLVSLTVVPAMSQSEDECKAACEHEGVMCIEKCGDDADCKAKCETEKESCVKECDPNQN